MGIKTNPSVFHRFTGREGKKRLIEAFARQSIVAGDINVAKELARVAHLLDVKPNKDMIVQGDSDNDIYFILSGSVSVRVNGREIAKRFSDEHIGEMPLIDNTARRSATIHSLEPCVVARISEKCFSRSANKHPDLWRRIAVVLSRRLKERNKFQIAPRSEPVIFIGSSSEGLKIAGAINNYLSRLPCVPKLWDAGVFEASKTTIEDLLKFTKESDFAVIVLTPDDITRSRRTKKMAPRDNVVFELGLFMGALSRERTYIVAPRNVGIKIPTDLLGVTCLPYEFSPRKSLALQLRSVFRNIRKLVEKYGPM